MQTYREMYQALDVKLGNELQFKNKVLYLAPQLRDIVARQLQAPVNTVHWGIGGNGRIRTETIECENGRAQFALLFTFAIAEGRLDFAVQVNAVAHPEHIVMVAEGLSHVSFDGQNDAANLQVLGFHVIEVLRTKIQKFKQ